MDFCMQFACPVVSTFLLINRKYQDLVYYRSRSPTLKETRADSFTAEPSLVEDTVFNSDCCCSKTPHVPGILYGTGRLSVLQISSFIGYLLH